jgi:rhomboid family GlyGly-CTERM serine protease
MNKPRALLSRFGDPASLFFVVQVIACLALATTGGAGQIALRYERAALENGEIWRLLTAHWVHLDVRHMVVNVAGLVLLGVLFARDFACRAWIAIFVTSVAAVDAGLWFANPHVDWYVGASRVGCTVFLLPESWAASGAGAGKACCWARCSWPNSRGNERAAGPSRSATSPCSSTHIYMAPSVVRWAQSLCPSLRRGARYNPRPDRFEVSTA